VELSSFSGSAVAIDVLLGCSLWCAGCSGLRGIVAGIRYRVSGGCLT